MQAPCTCRGRLRRPENSLTTMHLASTCTGYQKADWCSRVNRPDSHGSVTIAAVLHQQSLKNDCRHVNSFTWVSHAWVAAPILARAPKHDAHNHHVHLQNTSPPPHSCNHYWTTQVHDDAALGFQQGSCMVQNKWC